MFACNCTLCRGRHVSQSHDTFTRNAIDYDGKIVPHLVQTEYSISLLVIAHMYQERYSLYAIILH